MASFSRAYVIPPHQGIASLGSAAPDDRYRPFSAIQDFSAQGLFDAPGTADARLSLIDEHQRFVGTVDRAKLTASLILAVSDKLEGY
jgi:hypothetical protein